MNMYQPKAPSCQSCAMPMRKPEDFGTNNDGGRSQEYCRHCYRNGSFIEPNLTVDQMVAKCENLMRKMGLPDARIERTRSLIPTLKRWRK